MTSAIDYAAMAPAPVGLIGIRMSGGQLLGIDFAPQSKPVAAAPNGAAREVLDHERRRS